MEISSVQPNMNSLLIKSQHQPERKAPPVKSIVGNQQNHQNQDILKRKRDGEPLSIGEKELIEMIERANKVQLYPQTELRLSIHEKTKRISIKIINIENQEIIREISPEKVLDMVAKMWELTGVFVDRKI